MSIILIILAVAACIMLSISFVTTLLLYYETINGHSDVQLAARSRHGLFGALCMTFITDLWAQLLVILTFPCLLSGRYRLPTRRSDRRLLDSDKDMPILMLHGLYHNASAWALFRRRLRKSGYGRLFCYSYNSFSADFHDLEDTLAEAVERIAKMYPEKRIALIGHSLGGLLVRSYVARPEVPDLVACAIILGAPHKGSRLAAFGIGPLARSLRYDGPLSREIAAKGTPHSLPFLSIISPSDNYVTSADAMHVQGEGAFEWEEHVTPPMSHVNLLYSRKAFQPALDFLVQQFSEPLVP